jgi:hypothetical protein
MSNKILITNNTAQDVLIIGAQIAPGNTQEYTSYALHTLMSDPTFTAALATGAYTINNGTETLPSNDALVYLSSLSSGTNVIDVKSSLGYISTSVVTADIAGTYILDPLQANTWILTLTADTTIQLSGISNDSPVISFDVTLQQDSVGFHKTTFISSMKVTWSGNRATQIPLNPNGILTINLTSVDNGSTWLAKETYRKDTASDVVNEMFDSDNVRRTINNVFSPIGVQLVSQRNVASGLLSYRMLANASVSTAAEVQITVDGIVRHADITPSFYRDQLVTQDIAMDSSWDIRVGSVIEVLFRETSGAVTIQVKGDIQESTMLITNIVDGVPVEPIGVTSTLDVQMTTTPATFGLIWTNNTGDGFISATANLAFNVTADIAAPLDLSITVDGIQRYSGTTSTLSATQRLEFVIPIDESWQINAESDIIVYGAIANGAVTTMIMGSTARSELIFTDIVSGIPSTGPAMIEGSNTSNVILTPATITEIIVISPPLIEITVGEMAYSIMLSSNYASSCIVAVIVDGVERYSKQWSGIYAATVHTDVVPVDIDWGITVDSVIILTCEETSGNPSIELVVEGDISATQLTIASTL